MISEVKYIGQKDLLAALEDVPEESQYCALLVVSTLKAVSDDYLKKQKN